MREPATPNSAALGVVAFEQLSERARTVLWHVVLDRESTAEVAATVGCAVDDVARLIDTARHELRASLIRHYRASVGLAACHRVLRSLGNYHDGQLTRPQARAVADHLSTCEHCRGALAWISDMTSLMEKAVLPAVLGADAASRYLDQRDL